MSTPKAASFDTWVHYFRDVFDLRKKMAEAHHWPSIPINVPLPKKSSKLVLEWLFTTEYDGYVYYSSSKQVVQVSLDEDVPEKWAWATIYLVPKGASDAVTRVRETVDLWSIHM
jgi:hypothetical protein